MRDDWDARARENALYYIVTNAADSIEQFTDSADHNMKAFFADVMDLVPGTDAAVDIGCGMGRVLCMFARRPISKCIGVECDAELAAVARRNAATLRALTRRLRYG